MFSKHAITLFAGRLPYRDVSQVEFNANRRHLKFLSHLEKRLRSSEDGRLGKRPGVT